MKRKKRCKYVYVLYIFPNGHVRLYKSYKALLKNLYSVMVRYQRGGTTEVWRTEVYPRLKETFSCDGVVKSCDHTYELRILPIMGIDDIREDPVDENEPILW